MDAADESKVEAVVKHAIKTYGRLDVFFANAGIVGPPLTFDKISGDDFMNILRVNTLRYVSSFWSYPATRLAPFG